jgi:hypothetical protein
MAEVEAATREGTDMPRKGEPVDPKRGSLGNIRERNKVQGDAMADVMKSIGTNIGPTAPPKKAPAKPKRR